MRTVTLVREKASDPVSNHPILQVAHGNTVEMMTTYCKKIKMLMQNSPTSFLQLGFNIRGGMEHYCGIYLSKVTPDMEAERLGLKESDQILSVNGIEFEDIEHTKAVKILKSNTQIVMKVRYFPYGYRKTYDKVQNANVGTPA